MDQQVKGILISVVLLGFALAGLAIYFVSDFVPAGFSMIGYAILASVTVALSLRIWFGKKGTPSSHSGKSRAGPSET
jgi:uncharacterized membrane protein YedE/YeeE